MSDDKPTCPHCGTKFRPPGYGETPAGVCPRCGLDIQRPSTDQGWRVPLIEAGSYPVVTLALLVAVNFLLVKYSDDVPEGWLQGSGGAYSLRLVGFAGCVAYVLLGGAFLARAQSMIRAMAWLFVLGGGAFVVISGHVPKMPGPWWLGPLASPMAWVVALLWYAQYHEFKEEQPVTCSNLIHSTRPRGVIFADRVRYTNTYRIYEVDYKFRLFDLVGLVLPFLFFTTFRPSTYKFDDPPAAPAAPAAPVSPAPPPLPVVTPPRPKEPPAGMAFFGVQDGACRIALPREAKVGTVRLPRRPATTWAARLESWVALGVAAGPVLVTLTETRYDPAAVRGWRPNHFANSETDDESQAFQLTELHADGPPRNVALLTSTRYRGKTRQGRPTVSQIYLSVDFGRAYRVTAALPVRAQPGDAPRLQEILDSFEVVPDAAKR